MQFQVPQFIEVEDKIFGPLTFRQFIYCAGAAGGGYLLWRILPLFVAAPLIAVVAGLGLALALFQYNDRPFIVAVENMFNYLIHPRLYLWSNKNSTTPKITKAEQPTAGGKGQVYVPTLSDSKLHNLAWSLDIQERIAAGVADESERTHHEVPRDVMAPVTTARSAFNQ
jgi:hypothetical protein